MPQPLSTREGNLFRQVVRNYEDKQYKRGLKAAEQILKKHTKHGDTMAMKALILNAQGKTEEAFALGKEALTVDMKSHICWHVYGLLYRTNKNFEEAIKAYKFALKLEPESSQIQRDLAILQIQMRDYQGYIQSRLAMLQARPQVRQSWTALAVAHHLAGNLQEAENILSTYEETMKVPPSKTDFENSEAAMYRNMIIAETGDIKRALEHLESSSKLILDRLAVMEARARYHAQLNNKEEAVKAYRALLDRNPEHPEYYQALIEVSGIEKGDHAAIKAIYDEYAQKAPRCDAARRLPLDSLTGDNFEQAARQYLTLMLDKGVPSTFANLKHLYSDEHKKSTLPALVQEYLESHEAAAAQDEATARGDSSKGRGAALYFLAQHYNYFRSRDLAKATDYVDRAIKLDPENVDFHMTKARIWKHYGNTQKASEAMDYARSLDTKDRYINSKAAKYQIRNDETEKALQTMGLFTRGDTAGGPLADLLDMQCIWFLTEDGESHVRQGNAGLALKRFHVIWSIFDTWQEDQFDFHSFSLRKGLIRAYVEMMRWEDHLREHPFYSRAAIDAVRVYLDLYHKQRGKAVNGVNGAAEGANGEDAAEKKKAAKKAKKEAQKLEREAAEKAAKQDPNKAGVQKGGKADAEAAKKDEDPLGLKLAATTDPLSDAMKFLGPLLQFSPKNVLCQNVGFEVFLLRKKYLLALRCLRAALALDPEQPAAHEQTISFRLALDKDIETLPPKVAEVLKSEAAAIPSSAELTKFNEDFKAKHGESAEHLLAAVRAQERLGGTRGSLGKELVQLVQLDGTTLEDASDILKTLASWHSAEVEAFKAAAKVKWPEATVFS